MVSFSTAKAPCILFRSYLGKNSLKLEHPTARVHQLLLLRQQQVQGAVKTQANNNRLVIAIRTGAHQYLQTITQVRGKAIL